ncbi:hypothetical protein B0H13DRAFT_1857541 [Mycena leptocephala]|nr:hypothetical protein B0H13DRAFT_1857541 [Mycena leptocephala]
MPQSLSLAVCWMQAWKEFLDTVIIQMLVADFSQEYPALATRIRGDLQYERIAAQFLLVGHPQDKDFLSPRDAPIFPGYFGESVLEFPGVIQQGGLVLFINHDDEEELRPSALKVESTFIKEEDVKPFIKGEPLDLDLSGTMGMLPSGTKVSQGHTIDVGGNAAVTRDK